jgi:LysM repeat protein
MQMRFLAGQARSPRTSISHRSPKPSFARSVLSPSSRLFRAHPIPITAQTWSPRGHRLSPVSPCFYGSPCDINHPPSSVCGVKLPADVHPPVTNVTLPNTASSSSNASQTCISGRTYTVKPGDTCQTIAATYRVATGTLTIINALLPDCSNLLSDQKLCLPQACDTYLVRQGDTCASIAASFGLTIASLIAYNPAINGGCTNLIAGTNICLSPAAGTYTPTTISGVTTSPAGQYASSTVPAPGPTAAGTTKNCGMYYRVYPGDICQKISLNNSITVELFLQINSGVKASCDNLVPGLYYCVKPILGWNLTDTGPSTTAAPPAPTHSGTTGACYTWYIVQPGDYCALLQASFGLTFEQFRAWNPSIDDGCTNLLVGFA